MEHTKGKFEVTQSVNIVTKDKSETIKSKVTEENARSIKKECSEKSSLNDRSPTREKANKV